jgi:GTP-binding protein HflX
MEERQKAVIVGVNLNNDKDFINSMEELSSLAEACDIEVVGEVTQNLNVINTAHYLGKGKIYEVGELFQNEKADMIIFNDELTSSQIRNLESILKCRIIDRTILILDIFAQRARTREAQLQVEIAKLEYTLPRLVGLRESLGRQGGGAGFRNKGSGETKLELDRRKIEDRISALNKELETLILQRQTQRKKRNKQEVPVIALVGYTNAGKSSIMNALLDLYNPSMEKQVFEKNMLFATLETSVRRIKLTDNKAFLLTDTVGFISKLPHNLVKAFRSTLEEVSEADILIHVIDYSNPNYKKHIEVTNETLKALGADNIPVIYAYNKVDLVTEEDLSERAILEPTGNSVFISVKKKISIDKFIDMICKEAFKDYVSCKLLIPYDKGSIVSYLNSNATVKATSYENEGVVLSLECRHIDYDRYQCYSFAD